MILKDNIWMKMVGYAACYVGLPFIPDDYVVNAISLFMIEI